MAIASAAMLGIRFRENFHAPYLATSIRDFWRRWHISLSSWIRDYVYIPLGGSRSGSESRTAANLLMAMTLCGLWHGAAWTFVAWGMLHGLAIVGERFLVPRLPASRLWPLVSWCVTTLIVFTSWALFRANNFDVLAALIAGLLGEADVYIHKAVWVFVVMAALILYAEQAVLMLWPAVAERPGVVALARKWISRSISLRILIATTLTVLLLLLHYPQLGGRNFIYFQF
ncbi:MAG: MBOAT family protein, partial [Alphaproteobacteria bacterium]|nr:MBOAT family protein [Alphaproteobacteria bacterium]